MKRSLLIIALSLLVSACTWVKMTEEGEKVRVLTAKETSKCKEIGKATAMLKDKIAGISRNREKVKLELETLARNQAAKMGGDTIVPISEIEDGEQVFKVLKCVPN